MGKLNLKRSYLHAGKHYGPGVVEVPDEVKIGNETYSPYKDLQAKDDEYDQHLKAGGEPVAPITPSVSGNVTGGPENAKALNTPSNPSLNTTSAPTADKPKK